MDLSCGENMENSGNINERAGDLCVAGSDRALDRDPRVLLNLLALERSHALHTDYFQNVQIDIQPFMRKVVTTWMLEVSKYLYMYAQVAIPNFHLFSNLAFLFVLEYSINE